MNTICLVEDDPKMSKLLIEELEEEGFNVVHSQNGKIILEEDVPQLEAQVFIVDWNLPDLTSGIKVVKRIKENYPASTIFMISGYDSPEEIRCGLNAGAHHFLTKPFDISILVLKIKNTFEQIHTLQKGQNQPLMEKSHSIGGLQIKTFDENQSIMVEQDLIRFTKVEYLLIKILIAHSRGPIAKEHLIHLIGQQTNRTFTGRGLDVHMANIRKKIDPTGLHLINLRGKGIQLK